MVGVEPKDTEQTVTRMAERVLRYRVFSDAEGIMNLSVVQAGGSILLVSHSHSPPIPPAATGQASRPLRHPSKHPDSAMRWQRLYARVMFR